MRRVTWTLDRFSAWPVPPAPAPAPGAGAGHPAERSGRHSRPPTADRIGGLLRLNRERAEALREVVRFEWLRRPLRESLGRDRAPVIPWVAILLASSVVVTGLVTGSYVHGVSNSVGSAGSFGWPALSAGRWWTLASSFVLTRNWFMAVTMPLALLAALVPYERRVGHSRAFAVAGLGHVTGSVIIALACGFLVFTNVPIVVRAAQNLDYGGSMAVAAALGALASRTNDKRLRNVAFVGVLIALPIHHQMADWGHFVALPTGYFADRLRAPRLARVGFAAAAVLTAAATAFGAPAVLSAVQQMRFSHSAPRVRSAVAPETSPAARPVASVREAVLSTPAPVQHGRVIRFSYLAAHLEGRPEVAWVYLPHDMSGTLPVMVFLHDIPGIGLDWIDGGGLAGTLDARIAAGTFPRAVAVMPTVDLFHRPTAGWWSAGPQRNLESVRADLLPDLARRFRLDLRVGHVAVVGVGGGADGALLLGRFDPEVGWTAALDPSPRAVAARSETRTLVIRTDGERGADHDSLSVATQWSRWEARLGEVLDWLRSGRFGTDAP